MLLPLQILFQYQLPLCVFDAKGQSKEAYQRDASRTPQGWCGRTREGRHTMLLPLQILFQYQLPLCVFDASAAQLGRCTGTVGHQLSL